MDKQMRVPGHPITIATALRSSDHRTYCPYKGDASYYTLVTPGGELEDVVWTYEAPFDAVREITGHVAFYADRVDVSVGNRRSPGLRV